MLTKTPTVFENQVLQYPWNIICIIPCRKLKSFILWTICPYSLAFLCYTQQPQFQLKEKQSFNLPKLQISSISDLYPQHPSLSKKLNTAAAPAPAPVNNLLQYHQKHQEEACSYSLQHTESPKYNSSNSTARVFHYLPKALQLQQQFNCILWKQSYILSEQLLSEPAPASYNISPAQPQPYKSPVKFNFSRPK